MTISKKLVEPIVSRRFEDYPKEIVDKAKLCILHAFSCSYAGRNERWSKAAFDTVAELAPDGKAPLWFSGKCTNPADAAFVNAVYAQSILYEDIHRDSNAHPGIIIVPAAFALAAEKGKNGKELLSAVIAGYEMMGRVGRGTACAEFGRRGFRPTSIIGTFGSAVTAGLLLDEDTETIERAFSLAASFTSGINEWAIAGTDDLYFQNGTASRSGVVCAYLAGRGVTAPEKIIEGKAGVCAAFGFSLENLEAVDPLDGHYVITDVLFKPAPACALVQTTAQVALDVLKEGIKPEDIDHGVIHTFLLGKTYAGCDCQGPFESYLQARMSNQYNFATTLVHGEIVNGNYYEYEDPETLRIAANMELVEDPEYTAAFPVRQPVRAELFLKDGTVKEVYREEPVYLDKEGVFGRFAEHCADLSEERRQQIIDTVFRLDELEDVNEFVDLFIEN